MKKTILFYAALAAIATITTGCPSPGIVEPDNSIKADFKDAILHYYPAGDIEAKRDQFLFEFFSDNGSYSLDLFFSSDIFEDALQAVPANGIYKFSDSFEEFTFDHAECFKASGEHWLATGGSFTIERNGYNYSITFNLAMEDGRKFTGTYKRDIYSFIGGKEDVAIDFNRMEYPGTMAWEAAGHSGMWQAAIFGEHEGSSEEVIVLTINAGSGLTELPTGEFPMAGEVRKGVPGTAEPASLHNSWDYDNLDYPCGCWYYSYSDATDGYALYGVPGKGFVNIGKTGGDYTIEFSFEMPTGKTVSGSYTGPVYEPEYIEPLAEAGKGGPLKSPAKRFVKRSR